MKRILFAVAAALLAISTTDAKAASYAIECNDCAALQDMKLAAQKPAGSQVWVADYIRVRLILYTITYDARLKKNVATPEVVTDTELNAFLHAAEYRNIYGANATFERELNNSGSGYTTYDYLSIPGLLDQLATAVAVNYHGSFPGDRRVSNFHELMAAVTYSAWAKIGMDIKLLITIRNEDGSTLQFRLDQDHIKKAEYVKGSGKNSNGHFVPDRPEPGQPLTGVVGTWIFYTPEERNDFLQYLHNMGVPFTRPGGSDGQQEDLDYDCEVITKPGEASVQIICKPR